MSNFNLPLVPILHLATRAYLKFFSIYRPLATVCIDFHLGEFHSNAHICDEDGTNLFLP